MADGQHTTTAPRVDWDRLRAAAPGVVFVHLHGPKRLLASRLDGRHGHFMPAELLDSQLATALIAEYPTAQAFARANPKRLARMRADGRHFVGPELAEQLVAAEELLNGFHGEFAQRLRGK